MIQLQISSTLVRIARVGFFVAAAAAIGGRASAQTIITLPDTTQTTTLTATVADQARVTVPAGVAFTVNDIATSTTSGAASVTVSNIVVATALKQLRLSLLENLRRVVSPAPDIYLIDDEVEMPRPLPMAFTVNARKPFLFEGAGLRLEGAEYGVSIVPAGWEGELETAEEGIDERQTSTYRGIIRSAAACSHRRITVLVLYRIGQKSAWQVEDRKAYGPAGELNWTAAPGELRVSFAGADGSVKEAVL
jgi:hypothetical protein